MLATSVDAVDGTCPRGAASLLGSLLNKGLRGKTDVTIRYRRNMQVPNTHM